MAIDVKTNVAQILSGRIHVEFGVSRRFASIWLGSLLLALAFCLSFVGKVHAQEIPNQSRNRVICDSLAGFKNMVSHLPSENAIEDSAYDGPSAGCIWLRGTDYFTKAEIGEPVGWLFVDPYMIAVHALTNRGKPVLHASVVRPQSTWRMASRCNFYRSKFTFPSGESQHVFGSMGRGMLPKCVELVSLEQRAAAFNQPPTALSAHWQSRPAFLTYNACTQIKGLKVGLDAVVNEQQIRNSSTDVFPRKHGCFQRDPLKIVAARFAGLYLSNEGLTKPQFWFEIHQVAYIEPRTNLVEIAYLPSNPARKRFLKVASACQANTATMVDADSSMELRGATTGTVAGLELRQSGKVVSIEDQESTPIGRADCHIGTVYSNRSNSP